MYEETKDMSPEERRRWPESRRPTDPFLAELYDRAKPPTGSRWRDHGTHGIGDRDETQVVVEITLDEERGGYTASALGGGIHAQGDSVEAIRANVKETVERYLDDTMPLPRPKFIRLRFVRDEVIEA